MPSEGSIPLIEERPKGVEFRVQLWSTDSLIDQWPVVKVSFLKSTPQLDYLMSGGGIDICSKIFVDILTRIGARFEALPVTIIDRKTKLSLDLDLEYFVLHPLDSFPAFDLTKSSRRSSGKIKNLYPSKELKDSGKTLFRDDEHWLDVIRNDVVKIFELESISGVNAIPIEEYGIGPGKRR
jgi:hypothetical protein